MSELGLGFTTAQLNQNRRGQLSPEQLPPFGWELLGLCALTVGCIWLTLWTLRQRSERARLGAGCLGIALCSALAWPLAGRLWNALRDRSEQRACELTNVSSGVRASQWGMGIVYLEVGNRAFRAHSATPRAFSAVRAGSPYRVFYACHSGALASAEAADGDWSPRPLSQHLQELGELFGFDEHDLAENASGNVNLRQYPYYDLTVAVLFGALLMVLGVSGIGAYKVYKWAPLLGAICGAAGLGFLYAKREVFQDAITGRACQVEGSLTDLHVMGNKGRKRWLLTVNGTVVEVWEPGRGSSLLRVGQPYRAYYLCHSKQLASIEPLDDTSRQEGTR